MCTGRHSEFFEECPATESMYTLSMDPGSVDYSKHAADAQRIFSLQPRFVSPKELGYEMPHLGVPEFAFIGRSNVGKSTLISTLLGSGGSKLVRTSKEPGCTRGVNFFSLTKRGKSQGPVCYLVDLPGYGYAKASKQERAEWGQLIDGYVFAREFSVLRRTYVLIDGRYEAKDTDVGMIHELGRAGVPFQVIVTKADQSKGTQLEDCLASVFAELSCYSHPNAVPHVHVLSAKSGFGTKDLKCSMAAIMK